MVYKMKTDDVSQPKAIKRKLPDAVKLAIKSYYTNRKKKFYEKSKDNCIASIADAVKASSEIVKFTAIAGTFYFRWADGVVTEHDSTNWWRNKQIKTNDKEFFSSLAVASLR
jgi:hypothetical protein